MKKGVGADFVKEIMMFTKRLFFKGLALPISLVIFVLGTSVAQTERPVFQPGDCPLDLSGRVVAFECGWLSVPEDRTKPDGNQVTLQVFIARSPNPDKKPDPVFFFPGGPGGHGSSALDGFWFDENKILVADRDWVFFDVRGTGYSLPRLDCLSAVNLGQLANDAILSWARACRDRLVLAGIDLSQYNSAENAKDVVDLAGALGYPQINLFGISYGTRTALTVMRDAPQLVRSVVLDSPYPLEIDWSQNHPNHVGALQSVLAECAKQPECNRAFPDLAARLETALAEWDNEPFVYEGEAFDGGRVVNFLSPILYDAYETVPATINQILDGDMGIILESEVEEALSVPNGATVGQTYSTDCREEVAFGNKTRNLELAEGSVFATAFARVDDVYFDICQIWQEATGKADPLENQAVTSDIPTLILQGEWDPITPPSYSTLLMENLSQSQLVLFPYQGHGSISRLNACDNGIIQTFYETIQEGVDQQCVTETYQAPEFVTSLEQ
jgi:pimeloyl-ACP methyl ester carboxylesterase